MQLIFKMILKHAPGMIDGKKDLGKHLSQNQVLHIYCETQKEKLVSILQDLKDEFDERGL